MQNLKMAPAARVLSAALNDTPERAASSEYQHDFLSRLHRPTAQAEFFDSDKN